MFDNNLLNGNTFSTTVGFNDNEIRFTKELKYFTFIQTPEPSAPEPSP
jgi:hypothetical protein